MIITINGDEGAGKSTVAMRLAEGLGFKFYYSGQIFRDLARKRNLTVGEYGKLGENDPSVDKEIDAYVVELSKNENDFVIDSRMAWHFIPSSIKIFLKVDNQVGAERVFEHLKEKNSRNEVRVKTSVEELIIKIKDRKESDRKRYIMYYGADNHNLSNYDLVLDTTKLNRDEVYKEVDQFVRENLK